MLINLKQEPASLKFKKLADYYDEAYLLESSNFIGILTQELHNEPYMNIDFDEVDLINYQTKKSIEDVIDFKEQYYKKPQNIRANEIHLDFFLQKGWQHIKNKDGTIAILRKIRRKILSDEVFEISSNMREMKENDLEKIEELFKKEYPLRYRVVKYLYDQDKKSNFVYENKDKIVGITFNERKKEYLYCRQIFVKKSQRNKGIGSKLNQFCLSYARDNGLDIIFANIRGDTVNFYLKQQAEISTEKEFYLMKIK